MFHVDLNEIYLIISGTVNELVFYVCLSPDSPFCSITQRRCFENELEHKDSIM